MSFLYIIMKQMVEMNMSTCEPEYELQDDLIPPERCNSDGHPDSCKDCPNYHLRGHRADLNLLLDGFNMPQEDFDEVIKAFAEIPEEYVVSDNTLVYASSAWKGEENDKA